MKPIVIIGIAVGLSVVAVFGVVIAMDEIAFWQYETKMNNQQMRKLLSSISNNIQ